VTGSEPLQQQMFVPANCVVEGASTQIRLLPANCLISTPGLTAVPQPAFIQPAIPVQQQQPQHGDARQLSLEEFRHEVGKKLQFTGYS